MLDIHPITIIKSVGLGICLYSLLWVLICAKRKQWEECIKFSGYGMVGLFLFFGKEIAEVAKYIGGPIAFGGGL
ncbi:hypothetical protein COL63_25650 [Bacillus pseudomycoides]|uniref:hypothetical protein n=1 Tax=Bacillus pseudomycoides TaxID=64104 RepID=UPI000BF9F997|nr:hypothetical protein [Bacillus pseudomycoides]PFZ08122.1 hypothetical protein COL63_25650 [Bacillus pseudomycoides]